MLEGKEVEKKFDGEAGNAYLDVSDKGDVELGIKYNKDLDGFAQIEASNVAKTNIFVIAGKIAAKTATPVDDAFVQGLKNLLGIQG